MTNFNMLTSSVSIVIPAFNVEKYLSDAIDSILAQTMLPDEVIIIDDGSTDATPEILEHYEKIPLITVVRTENNGLGPARNLGATLAKSDYLFFLDADDYVNHDLIYDFKKIHNKYPYVEIFSFSFTAFDDLSKVELPSQNHEYSLTGIRSGKDALAELIETHNFHSSSWSMIFRRNLVDWKKKGFLKIIHEDEEMTPRLFAAADLIYLSDKSYYNYRKFRSNSIMSSSGPRKFIRSRVGYFFSLLSCLVLLASNMRNKQLALALLRRIRYLSYHAFIPLFIVVLRYVCRRSNKLL